MNLQLQLPHIFANTRQCSAPPLVNVFVSFLKKPPKPILCLVVTVPITLAINTYQISNKPNILLSN